MEQMMGTDLLEKMKREGHKWAVVVAEVNGKPHAIIALVSGEFFAMDRDMLGAVLPLLQKASLSLASVQGGCH